MWIMTHNAGAAKLGDVEAVVKHLDEEGKSVDDVVSLLDYNL